MLKYQFSFHRKFNITLDALTTAFAWFASISAVHFFQTGSLTLYEPRRDYLLLTLLTVFLWPLLLLINGIYPTDRLRTIKRASIIIVKAGIQGAVILMAALFILQLQTISRVELFAFPVTVTVLLICKESLAIWYFHFLRRSGRNSRNVIIAGSSGNACDMASRIEENSFLGLRVLGLLLPENDPKTGRRDHRILGNYHDIETVLHENPVDHVIIMSNRGDFQEIDSITEKCEEEGVEIWLNAGIFSMGIAKLDSSHRQVESVTIPPNYSVPKPPF